MAYKLIPEETPKSTIGLETLGRLPIQAAAGIGAVAPGFAGNIAGTLHEFIANPLAKAFGAKGVPYEESPIGKLLPTTQTHLKRIHGAFPSTKPQNWLEDFSQNLAVDAAELFTGGKALQLGKYAQTPLRSLGISLAGNTIGTGVSQFSGDESKGELAKRGTILGLSFFNPTAARNVTQNLYRTAEQLLPQNAIHSASKWTQSMNNLENKILRGRPRNVISPSEEFVLNQIDKFRQLIQNGSFNMQQLTAQKRSFNEELQKNLFNITNRAEKARARELSTQISHATKDLMKDYGKTNPKWWAAQSGADKAQGAIHQSNYIQRFLEKHLHGVSRNLSHILGLSAPAGITYLSTPAGALSTAGYLAAKYGHRIIKSPELRKHYAKVVGAAAAGNAKLMNEEAQKLDKVLQKSESKSKYKLLD